VRRALVLLIAVVVLAGCGGSGGGSSSQSGADPVSEANAMRHLHAGPAKRDKREDPIPTFERSP